MPLKSLTKKSQKKKAIEILETDKPMAVLFYSEWCPASQAALPVWRSLAKDGRLGYMFVEIEEAAIPEEVLKHMRAFPTYGVHDHNGNRHHEGALTDVEQLKRVLNLTDA